MSDSNRLLIAAAAIGLIVSSLVWSVIGVGLLTRNPESQSPYAAIDASSERDDRRPRLSARALEYQACADAAFAAADDPERRNKRDLCAQYAAAAGARQAADWAVVQTWVGVFGLALVLVTLWFNYLATNAATEQSKIVRQQFEEEQRPHFLVSVRVKPLPESVTQPAPDTYAFRFSEKDKFRDRRVAETLEVRLSSGRPALALSLHAEMTLTEVGAPARDVAERRNMLIGLKQFVAGDHEMDHIWRPISLTQKKTLGQVDDLLRAGTHQLRLTGLMVYQDLNIIRERGFCFEPIIDRDDPLGFMDVGVLGTFRWKLSEDLSLNFDRKQEVG